MARTGNMIEFKANGRTAAGYLAKPEGKGPGIIVIQEWWGLVDHIKDVADRFAAEGFVALAPDLFHGDTTTNPDEAGRKLMALDIAEAGKDLSGAAEYLLQQDEVEPNKVAAVGFCMGGQLALFAAAEHHDKISAAVDFYGIHPHVELEFSKLSIPLMGHFGKKDEFVPEDQAKELISKIRSAGNEIDANFYDAGHAFFNDSRPEAYHEDSAKQAWERTLTFLRKHLT